MSGRALYDGPPDRWPSRRHNISRRNEGNDHLHDRSGPPKDYYQPRFRDRRSRSPDVDSRRKESMQAMSPPTSETTSTAPAKQPSSMDSCKSREHEPSELDVDIRRILCQMCERVFWYMQGDREEKTIRTLQDEIDRTLTRASDAANVPQILRQKLDCQHRAKQKCLDRISAVDSKLIASTKSLLDSVQTKTLQHPDQQHEPQHEPKNPHFLTNSVLATVETKLSSLQASTEAACKSTFLFLIDQEKIRAAEAETQLKTDIENLKQALVQEKALNEAIVMKQNGLEPRLSKLTAVNENWDTKHVELKQALENQKSIYSALEKGHKGLEQRLTAQIATNERWVARHVELRQALDKQTTISAALEKRQMELNQTLDRQTTKNAALENGQNELKQAINAQQLSKEAWSKKQKSMERTLREQKATNEGLQKKYDELERRLEKLCQVRENDLENLSRSRESTDSTNRRIDTIAGRLEDLSSKHTTMERAYVCKDEAANLMKYFDAVVSDSAGEVSGRLNAELLDLPAGSKTRNRMVQLQEKLDELELDAAAATQEMKKSLPGLRGMIRALEEASKEQRSNYGLAFAKIESLKSTMSDVLAAQANCENARASSPPDNTVIVRTPDSTAEAVRLRLEESIEARLDRHHVTLQEKLTTMGQKLGSFIDNERQERENLSEGFSAIESTVRALRQEIATLQGNVTRSTRNNPSAKETKVNRDILEQFSRLQQMLDAFQRDLETTQQDMSALKQELNETSGTAARDVTALRRKLDSLESSLLSTSSDLTISMEELAMQLQSVAAWQSNFSTQPLYRDIVDHITATLPSGAISQVSTLTRRLETVETYLQAGASNPRKRTTFDVVASGRATTATPSGLR